MEVKVLMSLMDPIHPLSSMIVHVPDIFESRLGHMKLSSPRFDYFYKKHCNSASTPYDTMAPLENNSRLWYYLLGTIVVAWIFMGQKVLVNYYLILSRCVR